MDLVQLIKHPERMDKETLYDLRSLIALHPYYQTARLLMLQNLYILHDPTFDEELRKAAIYITDRKVIFNLVEAAHYKLRNPPTARQGAPNTKERESIEEDRTALLIDNFLDTIPAESEEATTHARRCHHRLCELPARDRRGSPRGHPTPKRTGSHRPIPIPIRRKNRA